ncbi:MAG: GUN4 domain-containing protein [Cyanobacteria bacterium P01_F01_bin.150]
MADLPALLRQVCKSFKTFLKTAFKIGYRKPDLQNLEKLLSEKRWREADRETNTLMLWAAYSEHIGTMSHLKLLYFPEETLMAIDALWTRHSNGRFGFNIKRHIYIELGTDANEPYKEEDVLLDKLLTFADCVGWRVDRRYLNYEDLTFDITAPVGHLPACQWLFPTAEEIPSDKHRRLYRAKALVFLITRW